MRPITSSSVLVILFGGGVLFAFACVLDFIIRGVLGLVFSETLLGPGLGVPLRFFSIDLFGLSSGYFSVFRLLLNWLIWCLVFAALFYSARTLHSL